MTLISTLKRSLDPLHGLSDATRQEFATWYRQAKVPQIRYVAFLTALLYLVYAVVEQQVARDQLTLRLLIHGVVVPATLLAVGIMSFYPQLYRPMLALLIASPVNATINHLYLNSHHHDFAYFSPELYLILIWIFAISGMTLRQAVFTGGTAAVPILATTLGDSLQPGLQHLHLVWTLAATSFGLLSVFMLEKVHKTMFLQQSQLALSASIDGLTGLWNRARIDQFFAEEIARAQRYGTPFSVILIDIDHFKSVNDTHGHAVGDTVLRQFAALLRRNVRAVDKVGRLGGEEFLIILPDADSEQARAAARTLQQRLEDFAFDTVQRKTASFGVAQFREGDDLPSMLERVDRALYKAKADGRNRIELL